MTELLSFIVKGSSEVQLQTAQNDVTPKVDPLRGLSPSADEEQELGEVCEQVAAWPAVEDPFLNSLVLDFHRKGGCHIPTLHIHEAAFRVLQLKHILALDPATLPVTLSEAKDKDKEKESTRSQSVDPLDFSHLFCEAEQKALSCAHFPSKCDIIGPLETVTNPRVISARYDFMRLCFQRIAWAGGNDENVDLSVAGQASHGPFSSQERVASCAITPINSRADGEVATSAGTVCYSLADLWGLNIQQLRMAHLEALVNADSTWRRNETTSIGCATASEKSCSRDNEIERLLPMVRACIARHSTCLLGFMVQLCYCQLNLPCLLFLCADQ